MSTQAYKVENLANIVLKNTYEYTKEVGLNRTVPYAKDGLKPVARALAYSLYLSSNKLKNNKLIKSQTACSDVIGKYHPHSMESVYDTAVKLAHDKGSILESGSVLSSRVSDSNTAPRYSDIRLSPLGRELFTTINLCEMIESDMGYKMPKVLMARFPYQLFTYYVNIGVGTSNSQLPLNPKEVIQAMVAMINKRIEGKEISTEEIMKYIKGPDLYDRTTIYMSKESLRHLIEVGTGSCIEVCDVDVYENKGEIHIKELPYRENSPTLQDTIIEKSNNYHDKVKDLGDLSKIRGIKDSINAVEDKSTEDDIRIIVKVDNDKYSTDYVLNELYNKTNIKRSHIMKHIMVDDEKNKLELYSVREIMENCIDINIKYYERLYKDELEDLDKQLEVNKVLEKVTRSEHTDFVGKAIYKKNKVDLLLGRKGLNLNRYEVEEILFKHPSILRRLSDRDKVLEEIAEHDKKRDKVLEKLKLENILQDVKNYYEGTLMPLVEDMGRSSEVIYSPLTTVTPKPRKIEVPDEKIVIVTDNDFIYSIYDNGGNEGYEELDRDDTKRVFYLNEDEHIVLVTEKMHVKIPVKELTDEPIPIQSLIVGLQDRVGENVIGVFPQYEKDEEDKVWYFVNNKGCVKTVRESVLYSTTKLTKSTIVDKGESIVDMYRLGNKDIESTYLFMATREGYVKLLPVGVFTPKGRTSKYNRGMNIKDGDEVVYTDLICGDFKDVGLVFKSGGEVKDVRVGRESIKPIMNRGTKVIKGKDASIEWCVLKVPRVFKSELNFRDVEEDYRYKTFYNVQ